MYYFYLPENEKNIIDEKKFNSIYNIINIIRNNKELLIIKSCMPRFKKSRNRGLPALKEIIKTFYNMDDNDEKYNEQIKMDWLNCFKLTFIFNVYSLNINGVKCLFFNKDIEKIELDNIINIKKYIYSEIEPNKYSLNKDDTNIINIAYNYIINENLTKDNIIKLFIKLLS